MTAARERVAPIAGHEHAFVSGTSGWTVLLLHGTGGDEHDLLDLGSALAPGAALLSPRGRVLENGTTNRFFARRGMNDIDVDDMLVRTDELRTFVEAATTEYAIDPARIVALGYSNGANIALSMLLRHATVLRAAVLLRPVLYHVPDPLPDLAGVDVLSSSGALDPYSPPDAIERLRGVLDESGARATVHVEAGAGHALAQADVAVAGSWLGRLLTA